MEGNIKKIYWIRALKWFLLAMPVIVPFFESNGLSMKNIMQLQAIFAASVVVLEIPSGYIGDLLGRKNAMTVGLFIYTIGSGVMAASFGFTDFVFGEILMGIGASLISGSDSALLYDSMLSIGQESEYSRREGQSGAMGNYAEAIAGVIGGFIAAYSIRYPWIFQTSMIAIAFIISTTLKEPKRYKKLDRGKNLENLKYVARYIFKERPILAGWIMFASFMASSTLLLAWLSQKYFDIVGVELVYYGILWGALNAIVGTSSWFAHRMVNRFSRLQLTLIIFVLLLIGFIGLAVFQSVWGIAFIGLAFIGRGFGVPIFKDFINELTDSSIRATVLSLRSFIVRILFVLFGPLIGFVIDSYSFSQAIWLAIACYFGLALISFVYLFRHKAFIKNKTA